MELKQFVRRGLLNETPGYRTVLRFGNAPPAHVLMLLEGRARRKLALKPGRWLYENFYPVSFVGLEDLLQGRSRPGGAGVYPGSHYVLWEAEDFRNALNIQPDLARRAIFELSRRIRICDERRHTTDPSLRREHETSLAAPSSELSDALYEMSFAEEDAFPPHLVEKFSRRFAPGEALMLQGDRSAELFIVMEGRLSVYQSHDGERRKIDMLADGDMVGEMAQFDGLPRSADVIAETQTTALALSPENFDVLFQLHPRWSRKLMETLSDRLEQRRRMLAEAPLQGLAG
ncbi:MAG: cyclic nucleotide-binding domain-containing protein [Leptospirales bacterium]|nr:cyclic nucleotide-binding domain-containing protein [Leptospirales bacterium]